MRWTSTALMVAAAACIHPPPAPSQGGPTWVELKSAHFTLWTDASTKRGVELLTRFEHVRSVVFGVAFPEARGGNTLVIAPEGRSEAAAYNAFTSAADGVTIPACGAPLHQALVFADAGEGFDIWQHEITHGITDPLLATPPDWAPRWLAEGLAQYFETLQIDEATHIAIVGGQPKYEGSLLRRFDGLVPVGRLFDCDRSVDCTLR